MIPFSPPRIDEAIINEVAEALRSGWITTGPRTKEFEKQLAAYVGCTKVICLNSATAGLELVLRWFGVKEGDEVIVPAYTYCSTANVIMHCGATPVMVDVNADDFTIDIETVKKAITPKTKVIMPVDIGGLPCNYKALQALISSEKTKSLFSPSNEQQEKLGRILLLADAAHSIGAEYCGKKTGVWADASCFSFHAVKNLTTAEGGAIALHFPENFDANEIYAYLNMASLHGQNKDALNKFQKGGWKYDIIFPGYKCNMTDIVASIGLIELSRYENDTLNVRRKIFDKYSQFFNQYAWAKTPIYVDAERLSSYHVYMLRINNCSESQRDAIISEITANGVSVNVHFQPLPLFTAYKNLGYKMEDYPVAFANYACEISLPVFYDLNESQQMQVMQTVKNAVEKVLQL